MRVPNVQRLLTLVLLVLLVASQPTSPVAHEGHDHGAPPPPVSKTIAPRADASSGDFEVVIVARDQTLVVYLDTFRGNEPVDGAQIEIDTPQGLLKPVAIEKEPGSYVAAAPFASIPGTYDLAITIEAKDTVDVLAATLRVPESPAVAEEPRAAGWLVDSAIAGVVRRQLSETSGGTWLALLLGFLAGVVATRLLWSRRTDSAPTIAVTLLLALLTIAGAKPADAAEPAPVSSRDVAQRFPDGSLFVPKSTQRILAIRTVFTEAREHRRTTELPGRVVPSPNASGLVQASVGGRLLPPPGGFKPLGTRVAAGDVMAFVQPPLALADATAQSQQARELDQQISIVARKVERLRSIRQVIAKSQLEDAELELAGLTKRRASLDRATSEPEALVAPVPGILAAANAVTGQMAEPNAVIFHIVDPEQLWVEAWSYDVVLLQGRARGQLSDGRTVELAHVGTGLADRNQAIPVHFSINAGSAGLRAGQFMTVLAETTELRRGIAVPRVAVLRSANGQLRVFEHANAESFVPREVRVEPLDGMHVLIVAGVEPGRRVVTQGAELLNQIR
jgi:cobalt-zinc-cadmium efflux system membrane fusion protein